MNFVKYVLNNGGSIRSLIIPSEYTNGTGLCNPSILVHNEDILVNIRHIQYTLYHSENNNFESPYGPLVYYHPENDNTLRTTNFLCKLDDNLDITHFSKVDTTPFDVEPLWEFVGLEDARLINWENKMYLCGVRRDVDTIGTGRMELSEIAYENDVVIEKSRVRIPAPPPDNEYCNKNWMPILDKPYHFVKWTNGTEVVVFDPNELTTKTVIKKNWINHPKDMRGGSHVLPFQDGYLCLVHETDLYKSEAGRKDATYRHRFVVWDSDWNIKRVSPEFSFLGAKIEFACGMAKYNNDYLITFGFQDNAAYILKLNEKLIEDFIYEKI
jgi:predicted GH43/DUF377 family glycosyl hydrolase